MKAQLETLVVPERVSFVGRFVKERRFAHALHFHPQIELTFIVKGSGTRIVGDHIESFQPGDLCLFGENLPHCYHQVTETAGPSEAEVLHFNRNCGHGIIENTGEFVALNRLFERARFGLRFSRSTGTTVKPLLARLRKSSGLNSWSLFLEIGQRLLEDRSVTVLASGGVVDDRRHAPSERIHKACQYLLDHYAEEVRHEAVARHVFMAPASFSRLFRRTTQMTYTNFLLQVRLGAVCRLLRETDLSVTEAAFASGFRSLAHFNRQFKKRYGCNPTEYRRLEMG